MAKEDWGGSDPFTQTCSVIYVTDIPLKASLSS